MALKTIGGNNILPVDGLHHGVFVTDIFVQALSLKEGIRIFPKAQRKVIVRDPAFQVITCYEVIVPLIGVAAALGAGRYMERPA